MFSLKEIVNLNLLAVKFKHSSVFVFNKITYNLDDRTLIDPMMGKLFILD